MTEAKLDEVIKRYTDNAEYVRQRGDLEGCMEFRELAEFLTECKKSFIACEDCVSREAVINAIYDNSVRENEYNLTASRIKKAVEALPPVTPKSTECEDAIDRCALRAQFNHLDEVYEGMSEEEKHEAYIYEQIIRAIDNAPPVVPKPRTGHWIRNQHLHFMYDWKCSECGHIEHERIDTCPNCHADMREVKQNDYTRSS